MRFDSITVCINVVRTNKSISQPQQHVEEVVEFPPKPLLIDALEEDDSFDYEDDVDQDEDYVPELEDLQKISQEEAELLNELYAGWSFMFIFFLFPIVIYAT